jgi:DNA-binding NtrC family response regulator
MSPRPEVLALGCRDDDVSLLSRAFERIEPDLRVMSEPRDLAREVATRRILAIVLGFGAPSTDRLDLIPVIHAIRSDLPVVVIADDASLELESAARREKIFYYLVHPLETPEIKVVLQDLLRYVGIRRGSGAST